MSAWLLCLAGALAAATGAAIGKFLIGHGFSGLGMTPRPRVLLAGRVACAAAGVVAIVATGHAGNWWLAPALLAWSYGLAACATCDAPTQRIPTALVHEAAMLVAVLVVLAAVATGHWRWVLFAAVGAAVAGLILLLCWRFAGAGFGDVRLAVLGGLGLVAPTSRSIVFGVAGFLVITLVQAVVVVARGGTRQTMLPYGPALAIAFAIIGTA